MVNMNIIKILCVFSFLLGGCSEEPVSSFLVESELSHVNFKGFTIPKFPTAQGQLNYAKSGFVDSDKKKAALQIVSSLFPESKLQCGNADLTLAYMNLGIDYRFADLNDYNRSIAAYTKVIEEYSQHPQILVKAHWYLGWIYCDLFHQKEKGLAYFRYIVKTWPEIQMGISSPVPWVSLVYPSVQKEKKSGNSRNKMHWAGIALLEIIRHTSDRDESLKAFHMLWKKYRKTVVTGLALNLMLENRELAAEMKPFVKPYMNLNIANRYLSEQIQTLAASDQESSQ